MPDQYGRIQPSDWNAITNVFQGVGRMGREKVKFDQEQADRLAERAAYEDIANQYVQNGIVDENMNITDQGYQSLMSPDAGNKINVVNSLKDKGKGAYSYMKAHTAFTGQLYQNADNQKNLHMLAFKKSDENFKSVVEPGIKAATMEAQHGRTKEAAFYIADTIERAIPRVHAKQKGDKVEIWEVVGGEKQESRTLSVPEALLEAQNYTRENYTSMSAAHIVAGYEGNAKPQTFNLKTPKGEDVRAVQIFKSTGVDYVFFNKDGSVMADAPETLEDAYKSGWRNVDAKAEQELAYKKAQTEKVKKETEQIGKPEPTTKKDTDDRKEYGEKRLDYINNYIADSVEDPTMLKPEQKEKITTKAVSEFNRSVMGWKEHGRVKSTGEMLWETQDGKLVNEYGTPVEVKSKKKAKKPKKKERKKVSKKVQDWRNKIQVTQ